MLATTSTNWPGSSVVTLDEAKSNSIPPVNATFDKLIGWLAHVA